MLKFVVVLNIIDNSNEYERSVCVSKNFRKTWGIDGRHEEATSLINAPLKKNQCHDVMTTKSHTLAARQ